MEGKYNPGTTILEKNILNSEKVKKVKNEEEPKMLKGSVQNSDQLFRYET